MGLRIIEKGLMNSVLFSIIRLQEILHVVTLEVICARYIEKEMITGTIGLDSCPFSRALIENGNN